MLCPEASLAAWSSSGRSQFNPSDSCPAAALLAQFHRPGANGSVRAASARHRALNSTSLTILQLGGCGDLAQRGDFEFRGCRPAPAMSYGRQQQPPVIHTIDTICGFGCARPISPKAFIRSVSTESVGTNSLLLVLQAGISGMEHTLRRTAPGCGRISSKWLGRSSGRRRCGLHDWGDKRTRMYVARATNYLVNVKLDTDTTIGSMRFAMTQQHQGVQLSHRHGQELVHHGTGASVSA